MSVITLGNKNSKSDIEFFKYENKYNITLNMVNKISLISNKNKILYFNYSYTREELKNKFEIFNNRNIILINKKTTIDNLVKYLDNSKPNYICVDYYKMVDVDGSFIINNRKIKYIINKIEEYEEKYNATFIININLESE
jgi:hypothetical protein